jgi:hypothetical protein
MKLLSHSKFSRTSRWLLAALMLLAYLPARAALEERWLLVFDTSWAMKKRLPATETAVKEMLATSIAGQLHEGDTVGVWTFDQQLRLGEFPLITWQPGTAAATISNLVTFVHKHRYKDQDETNLMVLQPVLGRVIDDSERLTVVIFFDGYGEINWTPYNDSINQAIRQNLAKQKGARQPFVLLLRTQFGKFVGSSVNFPPDGITLPPFPAPPNAAKPLFSNPPPPEPVAPIAPAAPKPLPLPALVIVGTTVGTNPAVPPPVTNVAPVPAVTNLEVPSVTHLTPTVGTNPAVGEKPVKKVSPPAVEAAPASNAPARISPVTNPPATNAPATNAPAATALAGGGAAGWWLMAIGVLVAAGLVISFVTRSRRPHSSLITDSMNLPPDPPRQP